VTDEFDDYPVQWLSEEGCERSASAQRKMLGIDVGPLPHIMEVLELARKRIPKAKGLELLARPDEVMGRAHAFANSQDGEIVAQQTIVEGALDDAPLSRYVIVHELQHIVHHPGRRKYRVMTGNEGPKFIADGHSAEKQADMLARAIFMPPAMVWAVASPRELADVARVPLVEAEARFRQLRAVKKLQAEESAPFSHDSPPQPATDFEAFTFKLWNGLPKIPGEHPTVARLCGIYRILWSEYGRTSQCGWFLERGRIVAHFSRMGTGG